MARNSFSSASWQDGVSSTRSSLSSTSSDLIDNFPITTTIDKYTDRIPWIINHVLECHLSSQLPLKIMFSFNAGHRVPTLKEAHKWWQYEPKGTAIIHFLISLEKSKPENKKDTTNNSRSVTEDEIVEAEDTQEDKPSKPDDVKDENIKSTIRNHAAYDPFMDPSNESLLDINFESEFADGRKASRGLPPDFIRKWCLDKVFTKDEDQVDFDQALTGIDYLQDLECRRREALREVALRLKIDKHNWRRVLSADPDAKRWVEDIQAQETLIEGFYASCFVDLRIWTMLHELKAHPFYKPNALAMLNTLYPPCIRDLPNDRIDRDKLRNHRAKFYNLIIHVTHEGTGALKDFETLLKNPACRHNWVDTRDNLRDYIELASKMIEQSNAIHDIMFFKRSAAVAYSIRSTRSRSTTASSSTSARTERQSDQNEQSVTSKNTAFDSEKPASLYRPQSTRDGMNSRKDTSSSATSNPTNESQKSDRSEAKVHGRKRLASPKRQHEYRQEYHTIPMNAPRTPCSVVITPNIPNGQSFSSSRSSNGDGRESVHKQQWRLRVNTRFTEQLSEAAHHSSFQSWVPLKDQPKMSTLHMTSYPDPWSRGPPNPKYQLRSQRVSEDEKLLRVLCRPEAPMERRASFPNGVPSSSSRARTSSAAFTKVKSRKMYKDSGATSFETLRAGSSTHISQQGSSTGINPMKQVEHVLKNNSDAIKAYQALDLRELPGYPSAPKAFISESTQRPLLYKQKPCGTSGGLRGRALSGSPPMAVSPLISQQVTPVIGASRKLQLRKTPLRDFTTDLELELHPANREHTFPLPQTTSAITAPRIKLRKRPLPGATDAETQNPSSLSSVPKSPLSLRQESPITPTPGIQLRETALHNSSVEIQTQNTSLSGTKSPKQSTLNHDTPPRMETQQKPEKLTEMRPNKDIQGTTISDRATKNMSFVTGENLINSVVGNILLPQMSPTADLSFLASPYEPCAVFQPRLRKKSSLATIICRKSFESLKSVRFEDSEICHENTSPKTPRKSSECSKTPRKSSESSKSSDNKCGDNALGISIPNAHSTTAFSHSYPVTPKDSCVDFPTPPLPTQILKKQKSLGVLPRRRKELPEDAVDLPKQAILKKQKSLSLFPRRGGGKEKDKSTKSAPISKSQEMGGIFDGSQQNCTAYSAHTATACREPYRFPVPPNRLLINQDDDSQSLYSPAEAAKTPIIKEFTIEAKPVVRVNTAGKSSAISNPSPISPANKVYGFIPPPLKKQMSFGGWETDLDIALEHEHRLKLEHAKAQIPSQQLMKQIVPSVDTISSNESNESNPLQLKKTTSKLSKAASFADDDEQILQAPMTPSSGKLGKLFMNAGANISAIFVGKNATAPNLHDLQGKLPKVPVSILSKKEGKEKSVSGKSKDGTIGRQQRAGALATLLSRINPSNIFSKGSHHKKSLSHKHKLVSYRRREQLLRNHFRLKSHTLQRYKKQMVLEDSQGILYAEGIKWLDRYKPFVRESPEVYRRKEWMRFWLLEGARAEKEGLGTVFGAPFLRDASVRVGVKRRGRDTRRRVFEGFVARDVSGVRGRRDQESGVERILEKIDWRKEGWFEEPRARRMRTRERGEDGEEVKKGGRRKHVMISTEKYDRY